MHLEDTILELAVVIEQLEQGNEDSSEERNGLSDLINDIPKHSKHLISQEILNYAMKVLGKPNTDIIVLH